MSRGITFFVPGLARTQGSMKAVQGRVVHADHELAQWREAVRQLSLHAAAQSRYHPEPREAVRVQMRFALRRPATVERAYPSGHGDGDLDKYERAILDALTQVKRNGIVTARGLLADDAQVCELASGKEYATPTGVRIAVSTLEIPA